MAHINRTHPTYNFYTFKKPTKPPSPKPTHILYIHTSLYSPVVQAPHGWWPRVYPCYTRGTVSIPCIDMNNQPCHYDDRHGCQILHLQELELVCTFCTVYNQICYFWGLPHYYMYLKIFQIPFWYKNLQWVNV